MSEIDDFRSALSAARTAVSAGDYAEARKQVVLAQLSLAAIPNAGNDSTTIQFRTDLNNLDTALTKLEATGTGTRNTLQFSTVTNVEPS